MNTNDPTDFFDAIERPLDASLRSQPSALSDLWHWSLQFDLPPWIPLLLALGLALTIYVLGRCDERRRWKSAIEQNARQWRTNSILHALDTRRQ